MMRRMIGLCVWVSLALFAVGCNDAFSPGRPRLAPKPWPGARPLTTPAAALVDLRAAYESRNLTLLAAVLDPQLYIRSTAGTRQLACTYACEIDAAQQMFNNPGVVAVHFPMSLDTIPVPTFAPLDPPGAVMFHLRTASLYATYRGGFAVPSPRSADVVIAPTGPRAAPWRIVSWTWSQFYTPFDSTLVPPPSVYPEYLLDVAGLASAEGAVRLLETPFSHAHISNAAALLRAVIDTTVFVHWWEITDSSAVTSRNVVQEAAYAQSLATTAEIIGLRLTLWPAADSGTTTSIVPSPSVWPGDPRGSLVYDLPMTNQRIEFRGGRVLDVGFRHSQVTVAKSTVPGFGVKWRVIRWVDRGPLPAAVPAAMPAAAPTADAAFARRRGVAARTVLDGRGRRA